jgi:hypothetical protein
VRARSLQRTRKLHRFCQKCGKVQPTSDFDGKLRTCSAALQRHKHTQQLARRARGVAARAAALPQLVVVDSTPSSSGSPAPSSPADAADDAAAAAVDHGAAGEVPPGGDAAQPAVGAATDDDDVLSWLIGGDAWLLPAS